MKGAGFLVILQKKQKKINNMDTQILKLEAPYEYIYCNGEVGKHIATYIVGESKIGEDGKYELETHSHPIVQYQGSPKGVVWNRAELTDCEVLCSEDDMRIDIRTFYLLCIQQEGIKRKSRQFVHLTDDRILAMETGKRHGNPVVLTIDSGKMKEDGIKFWKRGNGIWLTEKVEIQYVLTDKESGV